MTESFGKPKLSKGASNEQNWHEWTKIVLNFTTKYTYFNTSFKNNSTHERILANTCKWITHGKNLHIISSLNDKTMKTNWCWVVPSSVQTWGNYTSCNLVDSFSQLRLDSIQVMANLVQWVQPGPIGSRCSRSCLISVGALSPSQTLWLELKRKITTPL